MASDIPTNATFATANMKPGADEQIDALWGDKVADNTGFLYYRKFQGPTISFQGWGDSVDRIYTGTYWFEKQPSMATFYGSLSGTYHGAIGPADIAVFMNGTTLFSLTANGVGAGTRWSGAFGTLLAGIADGAMVPLTYRATAYTNSKGLTLDFTTWQKL